MSNTHKPVTTQTVSIEQALDAAADHHAAGELSRADAICRQILRAQPNQPIAMHMLGIIAFQSGRYDIAEKLIGQVIHNAPNYADAYYNLGNVLKKRERYEDAAAQFRKAIEIEPDYTDAHYNLGNLLKTLDRHEEALVHYQKTIDSRPNFAEAHNNLGNALKQLGRLEAAVIPFQRAIEINPGYAEAYYNLGTVLQALGYLDEATVVYQKAINIKPDLAVAHSNLGIALRTLGRLDEALPHYQQAIALNPDITEAHNNLALYYERTNQLDQAQACNSTALAIDPGDADSLFVKGILLQRRGDTGEAILTLKQLPHEGLSDYFSDRHYFELGKLLDQVHEHEEAFKSFTQGNLIHGESVAASRVDKDKYLARIDKICSVLNSNWVDRWGPMVRDMETNSPVFLVGFPRSGTTLLDQILDSHPGVQVLEEKQAFSGLEKTIQDMPGGYPFAISILGNENVRELRASYFEQIDRHIARQPGQLFVDKLPLNIEYVPLIHRLFPDARYIFACRHPCDVVLSNFMQYYQLNNAMASFFSLEDAVHLYTQVMGIWVSCLELMPLQFHNVHYESVVSNFEVETRALFEFLGIEWNEAALAFDDHARQRSAINTPSYAQVTQPVYQSAKYRWKMYSDQLAPFLEELAPFIEKFGYSAEL